MPTPPQLLRDTAALVNMLVELGLEKRSDESNTPDWQNIWVSLRVWLTTWDIGHRPSFKDIRLAEYLEKLYRDYHEF